MIFPRFSSESNFSPILWVPAGYPLCIPCIVRVGICSGPLNFVLCVGLAGTARACAVRDNGVAEFSLDALSHKQGGSVPREFVASGCLAFVFAAFHFLYRNARTLPSSDVQGAARSSCQEREGSPAGSRYADDHLRLTRGQTAHYDYLVAVARSTP